MNIPSNVSTDMPPVRKGEEYNLMCEAQGAKGDGLCKVENYVIFVEGAKIGKRYKVQITRTTERCGFAKALEEIE